MRTEEGVPGFSLGGVHSSEFGIYLVQKQIELVPESRDYELQIYGRPGQYDFGSNLDRRMIVLQLTALSDISRQDLIDGLRQLAAQINPMKGYQQLIFDDEPDKYYLSKYTSNGNGAQQPLLTYEQLMGHAQIGFKCDDPFAYATIPKTPSWATVAGAGKTLFNQGTAETPVVLTLTTNTVVSNVQIGINGIYAIYNGTINPGDTVVIDTGEMTYQKNGVNAIQYWSGDFPKLQPGQNTIDCNVALNLALSYRERWL